MIGLDTNVLLRLVTAEDPVQGPRARTLASRLTAARPGYVNSVVLAEFAWTLRSAYRYARHEILQAIENLVQTEGIALADSQAVSLALARCREAPVDFADALIAEINRAAGCRSTLSFDERAITHSVFTPVP